MTNESMNKTAGSLPEASLQELEVLLIDDDKQWARVTSVLLELAPEIGTVRTGYSFQDGIHELSETVPDCIVCDHQLGDRTGLELLEYVRKRYPALPFILVTGHGDEAIASNAIGRGVSDYLPKDHDDGEATLLASRIIQAVSKSVYRHQLAEQRDALEILNEIVRHDIRNALQLVVANADMLEGHIDEEGETYRNRIIESTREAIEITNTARDITNTFDQSNTDQTSMHLRQTIEQALEFVRATHDDVILETDEPIPEVTVRADETLDVVFRNLLTNAITHNDSSTPQITVSATATETWASVRITDNGPGIPAEQSQRIFQKGYTGSESGGSGLGLYLVKQILKQYGGTISVEEDNTRGTTFVLELPISSTTPTTTS